MNVLRIVSITCFISLFSTLLWTVPQFYPHNKPGRWVKIVLSSPFYKEQKIEVPVLSRGHRISKGQDQKLKSSDPSGSHGPWGNKIGYGDK